MRQCRRSVHAKGAESSHDSDRRCLAGRLFGDAQGVFRRTQKTGQSRTAGGMIPETGARRCLPQSRRPGDIMKKWMIALLMCGCLIDGFCQSPDISPVSPDIATAPEKAVTDPRAGTSSGQATSGQALYDTRNPDMKTEKTGIAIIGPGRLCFRNRLPAGHCRA